jgi:hypothetical protein
LLDFSSRKRSAGTTLIVAEAKPTGSDNERREKAQAVPRPSSRNHARAIKILTAFLESAYDIVSWAAI